MSPDDILSALKSYQSELSEILGRFTRNRDGIYIDRQDNFRFRAIVTETIDLLRDHVPGSALHIRQLVNSYNEGSSNWTNSSSYASVEEIRSVIGASITRIERNKSLLSATGLVTIGESEGKLLDALDRIILRFHAVAVQLRNRYNDRDTLDINDEYDVQDLMHALLRMYFDDVRTEEWVPSYAGSASRTDFLLPQIDTVVETKKMRSGLNARRLGEELIIDIAKYKKHPNCRRLVCFVYDPEGRISNPAGIENDLNKDDHGIEVKVSILPTP
ncbi:hypothetical protein [Cupriavidus alkaliphilus]|uniref:PD-(D/E)XK nuclease domain-containing protein n=1 Tax=Cupriavidus alkaliphilus TaxID=942866 RepID=UPI00161DD0CB|nr:hypothetical protein [Cupriavidus alkaliphilus]MBB3014029.1 hypothetical protein [Cupriavidus alkaliphilus]